MSKSKEEILSSKAVYISEKEITGIKSDVLSAMDEYAKQEAIEFAKWCGENCNDDLDKYNITSLYYIYLKSKTK